MAIFRVDIRGIKCDHCDFKEPDVDVKHYRDWLNKPCPKCGHNLLTQQDHNIVIAALRIQKIFDMTGLNWLHDKLLAWGITKVAKVAKPETCRVELNGTGDIKIIVEKEN